jgi:KUP system potassium uptake protein
MSAAADPPHPPASHQRLAPLALAALGVVYGDIGTSPLYALKECFSELHGVPATPANVFGVLSLIFWSLMFVVSFKYLGWLLRADNRGQGGIVALLALLRPARVGGGGGVRGLLVLGGVFGAALLYGEGVITPAISVLGALEGIAVVQPHLEPWVVWLSLAIIVALFAVQGRGTARVGALFGPVTAVWFATIAVWGTSGLLAAPEVLWAINPTYAVDFFLRHGPQGFLILGAVVLVVTGAEALYADLGHFGRRPIRLMWFAAVLPALLLSYFGQGALLLRHPEFAGNPFYNLVPGWFQYPMIVIATAAAVTASQALISGAFSLTQQAIQLGYFPRVTIRHTSSTLSGQIYIPEVNWALLAACAALVLGFRSTTGLAGAYGIAVTGTMTISTLLFSAVMRERWRWSWWRIVLLAMPFLVVDLSFLTANLPKVPDGGWFTVLVAAVLFTLMTTWKRGRELITARLREGSLPLELFTEDLARRQVPRVPGTAVFMTSDPSGVPPVLLHHLKHNKVLHERVVIMSFVTERTPYVPREERFDVTELGQGVWVVVGHYGFMETPDMTTVLGHLGEHGLEMKLNETSFYLGRETIIPTGRAPMAKLRKRLFSVMARNAQSATAFFGLPPNRVVELGAQIQL